MKGINAEEFCKWVKRFASVGKIVKLHTGYTLEIKLAEPIIERMINMRVEKTATKTTFIPKDEEAYSKFYIPSVLDFEKKFWFFIAYRKPFWVVFKGADGR